MTVPVDTLAATVREHIDVLYNYTSDDANPPGEGRSWTREQAWKALAELVARATQAEADRDDYRAANESVRVCADHTADITDPRGECLVCEAARLREERDALEHRNESLYMEQQATDHARVNDNAYLIARAEAAEARLGEAQALCAAERGRGDQYEARCARLQQTLTGTRERTAPDGQPCWCPEWKVDDWRGYSVEDWRDPDLQAALHHECCIAAREALAGPDTPADSQPEETT